MNYNRGRSYSASNKNFIKTKGEHKMKLYKKEIIVCELEGEYDGFIVEIHQADDVTELYLYNKRYGIKELMFGLESKNIVNEQHLLNIIEANIEYNVSIYRDTYMDEYLDD